jgi:predicted phage terminase large subunit-like protein
MVDRTLEEELAQRAMNPLKLEAELSLYEFTKQAWHCLHPTTPFTEGWAVGAVAEHLQAVTEGKITRLLINIPPGCTKSMLTNVMWPSWEWGPQQLRDMQYINSSYDMTLASRDMVNGRDLISSEWFQNRWPIEWKEDDRGKTKFSNVNRGFRFACSVNGNVMGWRGQRFIIDDPHNTKTAESDAERGTACSWFTEATPTRFTDPKKPVYVIIMQRLHVQDISGTVIQSLMEKQDWVHLCLPMEFEPKYRCYTKLKPVHHHAEAECKKRILTEGDAMAHWVDCDEDDPDAQIVYSQDPRTEENELLWPERHDAKSVRDLKVQLTVEGGEYAVAGQLQQRPIPREGGMFKLDKAGYCDVPPEGIAIRGWDLAATKDRDGSGKKTRAAYTVGCKMTLGFDGTLTVDDVQRIRGDADEVRKLMRATAEADGYAVAQSVPQDPGQAGKGQVLDFAKILHGFDVRFSLESGDKEVRAEPLSAQWNAGNVKMVRAPWNAAFLAEITTFPGSTFKDQVDAAGRAYHEHLKDVGDPVSLFGPRLIG